MRLQKHASTAQTIGESSRKNYNKHAKSIFSPLTIIALALTLNLNATAQLTTRVEVLNEKFDGYNATGWTTKTVSGTTNWEFHKQGTGKPSDGGLIHAGNGTIGSTNAHFPTDKNGHKAKLITPSLDLTSFNSAELTFYHTQQVKGFNQSTLKVYYSTEAPYKDHWILLDSYDMNLDQWIQSTILLSSEKFSSTTTFYLAFEGIAKKGYGICLDDVVVTGIKNVVNRCQNCQVVTLNDVKTGTLGGRVESQWTNYNCEETTTPNNYNAEERIFKFTAPETKTYDFQLINDGSQINAHVSMFIAQTCNSDGACNKAVANNGHIILDMNAGDVYYIIIDHICYNSTPQCTANYKFSVSPHTPQPVELLSFEADCRGRNSAEIRWTTATETNNDHFVLEKSKNAVDFVDLTQVDGAGNSNEQRHYSFVDTDVTGGNTFYRLTQVDIDGNCTSSDIITVNCQPAQNATTVNVYPNPFDDAISLTINDLDEPFVLDIIDNVGKTVFSKRYDAAGASQTISLDVSNLRTGVYNLRLQAETQVVNRTVVKM